MNDFALGVLVWKSALVLLFCKSFAGVSGIAKGKSRGIY
jgi:hypothetical protein